jgi:UDP-N-acetylglucosamine 2-epimerase (hydrolysing)
LKHVLVVFGTRPEAIKMAPVVAALRARDDVLRTTVCVTAQHREMLDQVLSLFGIVPEIDLGIMRPGQTLSDVAAAVLTHIDVVLKERQPDAVLVHGDTTTAMATALAAFHRQIPVGHVEAGLRSGRMDAPFPEEMNRVVVDRVATHLFAPTPGAAENLRREGADERGILVTGNTAIDALLEVRARVASMDLPVKTVVGARSRIVLVTAHRREAFGKPFADVCTALQALAVAHPDVAFVYPVHLNPQVRGPARERLSAENVHLLEPVDYASLVWLLDRCEMVMTDSGGIQEEAPALGKPVLVLRDVTERPELIEAGGGILVGTNAERIAAEANRLLDDAAHRATVGRPRALFGDGRAAVRITARLAGEAVKPWSPMPAAGPNGVAAAIESPIASSSPASPR